MYECPDQPGERRAMIYHSISDWDNAYANSANIAGGDRWPTAWDGPASAYRERMVEQGRAKLDLAYGDGERHRYDLFLPDGDPKGLVVFIHGGYWLRFDKSTWSHLAAGSVDSGYAVAMPTYSLCPSVRIADITGEVGRAVTAAAKATEGPIMLTGHSAGGHLASRMISATSPLPQDERARIRNVVSISGLHDLRPMMHTAMNADLKLDLAGARAESPALLEPMDGARICCWVGGGERSEFIRQSELLANAWAGCGVATSCYVEPDRHHYSVIDGLMDAGHSLTRTLLEG
jgi:acetyl esterase/lipase